MSVICKLGGGANGDKSFIGKYTGTQLTLLDNVESGKYVYSNENVAIGDYTSYTKLLMHFNGNLSDDMGNSITNNGATLNLDNYKFGIGCLKVAGVGGIQATNSAFAIGTSDFTLDFFINKYTTFVNDKQIIGLGTWGGNNSLYVLIANDGVSTKLYVRFINSSGVAKNIVDTVAIESRFATGVWTHVAVTKSGDTLYLFIGGSLIGSVAGVSSYSSTGTTLYIGQSSAGSSIYAYLDEVRLLVGLCKWTAGFTPPATQNTPDTLTGQLIPSVNNATAESQLVVASSGALKTLGSDLKRYLGVVTTAAKGWV